MKTRRRMENIRKQHAKNKIRRQFRSVFAGVFLIFCACLTFGTFFAHAQGKDSDTAGEYTCYTSIVIQPGDSLWSISNSAVSAHSSEPASAADIAEYTAFLMDINHLTSDQIQAGQNLIVAYK